MRLWVWRGIGDAAVPVRCGEYLLSTLEAWYYSTNYYEYIVPDILSVESAVT